MRGLFVATLALAWLAGCDRGDAKAAHSASSASPADGAGSMPGMDMSGSGALQDNGVHVAPDVAGELGIATAPATSGSAEIVHRAPASVGWDPLAVTRVTAQPGGQVRSLALPRPGETVEKGQVVARLYQPDVRAAFEELKVAHGLGEPWTSAARSRLLASGLSAGEIDAALRTGTTPDTYAVRATSAGVVLERDVAEGAWLPAGGQLGVVGKEGALVVDMVVSGVAPEPGTAVTLRDPSSATTWAAKVATLLPTADVAGVDVRLVPETSPPVGLPLVAEWTEPAASGGVWVPDTALVDTGKRRVVFVATSPGMYEPRDVTVGARADGKVQLLGGVAEGEPVVVSGTFLLDSETQIGGMAHSGHGSH